ncbi:MAG: cell division protein FtsA [Flavobacteriales bacterium]|nr:cell division protein FtsA [Flavobacteriales bacterium]
MDTNEIVAGLDIGTTKIACIVGRRNEQGKLEILGMGKSRSEGVSRGVVANIQKTVDSIQAAIREAEDNAGVDIETVTVGIAGQHIRSMHHRGQITRRSNEDEIHQKDIDQLIEDMFKLVMPAGEEIIHVLPQEYMVDGEQGIRDPIGMSGVRLEANFHIISGQITAARNINKCVHRANLNVMDLVLEPLASADSVLSAEEKEAGVVLVDIGGGTTDIAIFQDHIIRHTAVIPFGGNVITEDIRHGCGIMRDQAELLKVRFGSALAAENKENEVVCIPGLRGRDPKEISFKTLAEVIQPRMEEILEHVYFEIKNSGMEKQLIGGIVLTGGGAQLKHLRQLCEYITGMGARIGYPNEHLAKSHVEHITSPMYATSVGLVMKGFEALDRRRPLVQAQQDQQRVKGHSQPSRVGSFFDKVTKSFSDLMSDDEN